MEREARLVDDGPSRLNLLVERPANWPGTGKAMSNCVQESVVKTIKNMRRASFDLALTRFSGRTAPPHPGGIPNCADWVTREATATR
jgi:hypothetical protein